MKVNHTLSAILTGHWLLAESSVEGLATLADLYIQKKLPEIHQPSALSLLDSYVALSDYADPDAYDNVPKLLDNGILVFPIMGVMMQNDVCYTAGTITMTNWVQKAQADPAVKSILFLINSPGGQATGTWELATAIKEFSDAKYSETFANGYVCSAAMYVAAATNRITASSPDVMVGSIGVAWGYRQSTDPVKYVYASTSQLKHGASKALRETGDASLLQSLELDPMHKTFKDFVQAQRPQVSADALAGLEVVASKSIELNTGLVDGIDSLKNTLARMSLINQTKTMSDTKQKVKMLVPVGFVATVTTTIGGEKVTAEMEAEEVKGLNLQIGVQAQQITDLQTELQTAKNTASTLHDSIQTLTAEKQTLETDKAGLANLVAEKDNEISTLTAKLAEYEKTHGKAKTGAIEEVENKIEDPTEDSLPGYKPLYKGK